MINHTLSSILIRLTLSLSFSYTHAHTLSPSLSLSLFLSLPSFPSHQDLDNLQQIWELIQEWQTAWNTWKGGMFAELQTEDMGMQAQIMLKKLTRLAREVKVWDRHGMSFFLSIGSFFLSLSFSLSGQT